MKLKQFTDKGLNNFKRAYLDARAASQKGEYKEIKIKDLLSDEFIKVLDSDVTLPLPPFKDRYDFAEKIILSFGRETMEDNYYNINMWSFLACYYFKELCIDGRGRYIGGQGPGKLGDVHRVVLDTQQRVIYRHLVRGPALLYYETGAFSKQVLSRKLTIPGEVYEQVASRTSILCGSALGIINKVGWDAKSRRWKKGAAAKLDWSAREIANTINQLAINYSYKHCETYLSQAELFDLLHENQKVASYLLCILFFLRE